MATPDNFIEISNFSPGIFTDFHAQVDAAGIDDAAGAASLTNGAAQEDGTFNCYSDKTGALVPMHHFTVGMTTPPIPTSDTSIALTSPEYRPPAGRLCDAYLLDGQVGPIRGIPLESRSIFALYNFRLNGDGEGTGVDSDYDSYVIGREWRMPITPQPIYDFLFAHVPFGSIFEGIQPGNLTLSRWNGSFASQTQLADGRFQPEFDSSYYPWVIPAVDDTADLWMDNVVPVVVALVGTNFPYFEPANHFEQGTIPSGLHHLITKVRGADGLPDDMPYTEYTPSMTAPGTSYYRNGVIMGMNIPSMPSRRRNNTVWTWHEHDDFYLSYPYNIPRNAYLAIQHQGRMVYAGHSVGGNTVQEETNEVGATLYLPPAADVLWYSDYGQPINDWYLGPFGPLPPVNDGGGQPDYDYWFHKLTPFLAADDLVAQIGCVGVITGDELLVVKFRDGGAIVRGDLDNPTVRRLPYIESTHGVVCKGAQTPVGFVYGSLNGIYAWQGGDTAKRISPQLDGFFWNHVDDPQVEQYQGCRGRMCFWNHFVAIPNNYFYNTDSESWWRSRDASPAHHSATVAAGAWNYQVTDLPAWNVYDEDYDGRLCAFPYRVNGTTANVAWYEFSTQRLSPYYSWHSQPLVETRGRKLSFQEVRLLVSGVTHASGKIRVTLTGFTEEGEAFATDVTTDFDIAASDKPQMLRQDILPNFLAEYVTVKIEATSNDSDYPAPKVRSLRIGVRDRATTIRAGA